MRIPLRVVARLSAVGLMLAASLPGPLQLVHQHAGGEHAHVHIDAETLALHDLLEAHEHGAHHSHAHPHPHPAERSGHANAATDGPDLWAATALHVHGLNPLQQVARTGVSAGTGLLSVVSTRASAPRPPSGRPLHAARPRGPPTFLVG